MRIIVRKSDNIIVFVGDDLTLKANGLFGKKFQCLDATSYKYSLIEVETLPDNFICGGFTYENGVFTVNQTGIDYQSEQQSQLENENKENARQSLTVTDKSMARVSEDLVEVLITKGVIDITDLPQTAQDKITKRKNLRSIISGE